MNILQSAAPHTWVTHFFFFFFLTTGSPQEAARNKLQKLSHSERPSAFSGFWFVKHAKVNFLRAGLKRLLHILDFGEFTAKNVWNKSQTKSFSQPSAFEKWLV